MAAAATMRGCIKISSSAPGFAINPINPLTSKPPPAPPCQGECSVCPSPEVGQAGNPRSGCSHKGRLGGVGVEFLPNGQSGLKTHGCARIGNPLRFNPADNAYGLDTNRQFL